MNSDDWLLSSFVQVTLGVVVMAFERSENTGDDDDGAGCDIDAIGGCCLVVVAVIVDVVVVVVVLVVVSYELTNSNNNKLDQ